MRPHHPSTLPRSRAAMAAAFMALAASTATAGSGTVVPLGSFRSIATHDGAHVILRHGDAQRVTILEGDLEHSSIAIVEGNRLRIEKCSGGCPRGYRLLVEIVTPDIDALAVNDGGWIEGRGTFPRRESLAAAVENGGTIDVRAMTLDAVVAAVHSGGRILAKPERDLVGAVAQGGAILYWGNPSVTSSIDHGGVIQRGKAGDGRKAHHEIGPAELVPPAPPAPPARKRTRGA